MQKPYPHEGTAFIVKTVFVKDRAVTYYGDDMTRHYTLGNGVALPSGERAPLPYPVLPENIHYTSGIALPRQGQRTGKMLSLGAGNRAPPRKR